MFPRKHRDFQKLVLPISRLIFQENLKHFKESVEYPMACGLNSLEIQTPFIEEVMAGH